MAIENQQSVDQFSNSLRSFDLNLTKQLTTKTLLFSSNSTRDTLSGKLTEALLTSNTLLDDVKSIKVKEVGDIIYGFAEISNYKDHTFSEIFSLVGGPNFEMYTTPFQQRAFVKYFIENYFEIIHCSRPDVMSDRLAQFTLLAYRKCHKKSPTRRLFFFFSEIAECTLRANFVNRSTEFCKDDKERNRHRALHNSLVRVNLLATTTWSTDIHVSRFQVVALIITKKILTGTRFNTFMRLIFGDMDATYALPEKCEKGAVPWEVNHYFRSCCNLVTPTETDSISLLRKRILSGPKISFFCYVCSHDARDPVQLHTSGSSNLSLPVHILCLLCLQAYVRHCLSERILRIRCPYENCDELIPEETFLSLLDQTEVDRWNRLTPTLNPYYRHCPIPDCSGYYLVNGYADGDCTCPTCHHHWCSICMVDLISSEHVGLSCDGYRELCGQRSGEIRTAEFIANSLRDRDGADRMRRCPHCNYPYMKDSSCNHVVCTFGCRRHFCFKCAQFHADNAEAIYLHQATCPGYL